jgi:hypothetical protein
MVLGIGLIRIDIAAARRGELATLASAPRLLGGSLLTIFGFGILSASPGYIRLGVARRMWDGATIGNCTVEGRIFYPNRRSERAGKDLLSSRYSRILMREMAFQLHISYELVKQR